MALEFSPASVSIGSETSMVDVGASALGSIDVVWPRGSSPLLGD